MVNPSIRSSSPSPGASRASRRFSRAPSASSVGTSSAASRNAPSSRATVLTAPIPLPRTSPMKTRSPHGLSWTAYRSPPIRASVCAAR